MADSGTTAAAVGGLGLGGGWLGAKALADTEFANGLLLRLLEKRRQRLGSAYRGPDLRVPVYAGLDPGMIHGSGEGVMGANAARALPKHGIPAYFVNTNGDPTRDLYALGQTHGPELARNHALWRGEHAIDSRNLAALDALPTDYGGQPTTARKLIVSKFVENGVPAAQAEQLLRSGRLNGFKPGELLDTLSALKPAGVREFANGTTSVMPSGAFARRLAAGKVPHLLTTEAGMNYTTVPGGNWQYTPKAVAENTNPWTLSPQTRNLSLDTQFQANYRGPGDHLIPNSAVHDPGFGRRSALARRLAYYRPGFTPKWLGGPGERAVARRTFSDLAKGQGAEPLKRGQRYMLISTGSAGANAAEKLRLAGLAFKDDPNVRILMQYGSAPKAPGAPNLYTNPGVMQEIERLNRARPGFVVHGGRLPNYPVLARAADLHGAYGGSSSITEAMSHLNPTVAMTDTLLNEGNSGYAAHHRGIPRVNSSATALKDLVRSGAPASTVVNTRDPLGRTLGEMMQVHGIDRNTDFGAMERRIVQQLRDAMYRSPSRFNRANVAAANKVIADQRLANRDFYSQIRRQVVNSLSRHDNKAYAALRPGGQRLYRGLSRALFKTPAGRRLGVPLAIAGALGLGGGIYSALKN